MLFTGFLCVSPQFLGEAQHLYQLDSYLKLGHHVGDSHSMHTNCGANSMRRGTIFVVLFILVAVGIVAASQFLRSQPPLEITVAVDPLAQVWAQQAISDLNASQPVVNATQRVIFKLQVVDDLDVWGTSTQNWTIQNHPDAWIAASSTSVQYALENGLSLVTVADSLARTPMVWGGYASRVEVATEGGTQPLDWAQVEKAATAQSWSALGGSADWRFVNLAYAQPSRKIGGLAVLLSGAGAFNASVDLPRNALNANDFRNWLKPVLQSVPSFATLGADPAAAMARGASVGDIGLMPESQWLVNLPALVKNEEFRFNYPAYGFILDFPLARWQDTQTAPERQAAIDLLHNYLSATAQQTKLLQYGLRPATTEPDQTAALFAAGIPYGIALTPDYGQLVVAPSRSDVQGLIQWVTANQ